MQKNWQIRLATEKDAEGLAKCMQSAYKIYKNRMGEEVLPPLTIDYEAEIQNFPTWVVEYGDSVVGGLTMSFEESYATLANIAVCPSCQGYGVGRSLMEFAEAKAKEKGYEEMRLATHVLLTENVSLYAHLDWCEYDRDRSKVYMKKRLH